MGPLINRDKQDGGSHKNQTFMYIKEVASINNIEAQEPRQRKRPRIMDDNYVCTDSSTESLSSSESLKIAIYFPVIDHILSEIDRRFN